jgi:hypothetical protein
MKGDMMSEWKPIETAPKDGRFLLLQVPDGQLESGEVTVGAYWKADERAENGQFKAGNWDGWLGMDADVGIGWKKSNVPSITISANPNGVRGDGKRVNRTFPQVPNWKGTATFVILDDTVTKPVFERHLKEAGRFVGIGRFRPENGGLNGRFEPTEFSYEDV